ncbi:efflux transporter outer membrane subunit [Massilia soli]|uniref:Efflux transporter outer membrane subunit n=1 Tax=Massilia soli TaxID=2792854 RepID=A0ABS7SPU4_9BURK|nr:efflux transporter outer membrane subunit [Massilia soli]MBZ2208211.1 efflux transporter outer membrane subunit [Massilia soli]
MTEIPFARLHAIAIAALLLGGCAVGPTYQRPSTPEPAAFKEAAPGWSPAQPADMLEKGPWWTLFGDPVLNQLASQVEVSNQNVAAAVASYAQARALVQAQRASLFPEVGLNTSADRSGGNDVPAESRYRLSIGGSWEPDIWGRLRAGVSAASAGAEASAADLAAARLSAQGELAINYFLVREADAQLALLATTIEGYQRVSTITQNRFNAGIVAKSDVLQAQTQLANAQGDQLSIARQRAQFENAIAILVGKSPSSFSLAAAPWTAAVPDIPVGVPSTLLERRPDIAAAERRVAAANQQIGIARSAYYPSIGLSGSYGTGGSKVGDLFSVSNALWSFGLSAAQSIFNAGATRASVAGAEAQHEVQVARYRQTVLAAFGDVENQLAAARILASQQVLRKQASDAADQVETQMLNRYKAGQVGYSEVVLAQASALSARRALVQVQADRQATAVALIQSIGGGWKVGQ